MAQKVLRPGRTLIVFFLVTVLLYGLAALAGEWKPKLGLDLEGGTRITLTVAPGTKVTDTKLRQAADIIDSRVNGRGVTEAEVTTQGGKNVVVEIPGKNPEGLVKDVQRTAQLRFRLVAGQPIPGELPKSPAASPSASPSGKSSATPSPSPAPSVAPGLTDSDPEAATRARAGRARSDDHADPHARPVGSGHPLRPRPRRPRRAAARAPT